MTETHQKIVEALFGAIRDGESLYAILDTARNVDIHFQLQNIAGVEHVSLYKGRKEEPMWDATPYLVRCVRDSEFFNWVIERGWGDSWGIFLISKLGLEDLCKHFQEFLVVQDTDGKQMYFRFYDPRILPLFLSNCTREETVEFFGPVTRVFAEDKGAEILRLFSPV